MGSDPARAIFSAVSEISIHAPRMGSDKQKGGDLYETKNFNPRSPHGERLYYTMYRLCFQYFNPRSPHGERQQTIRHPVIRSRISIHAPRMGSDTFNKQLSRVGKFQSTLPAWGATCVLGGGEHGQRISIHAPRMGSDLPSDIIARAPEIISIHAPRMGSDALNCFCCCLFANFNPRSPHGERQYENHRAKD